MLCTGNLSSPHNPSLNETQPFSTPIHHWFDNELSSQMREVLLDPNNVISSILQRDNLHQLVNDHFRGKTSQVEVMFRLLTLELWAQRFTKATDW